MIRKIYRLSIRVEEVEIDDPEDEDVQTMPTEGFARTILVVDADLQTRAGLYAALDGARETVDDEVRGRRDPEAD